MFGEGLLQADLRRKIKLGFKYLMTQTVSRFDLNIALVS